MFWKYRGVVAAQPVNVLNATELFALKRLILWVRHTQVLWVSSRLPHYRGYCREGNHTNALGSQCIYNSVYAILQSTKCDGIMPKRCAYLKKYFIAKKC